MKFEHEVEAVLNMLRTEKKIYKDYLPNDALKTGNNLVEAIGKDEEKDDEVLEQIIHMIKEELPLEYPTVCVWWYSVLLGVKSKSDILLEFIKYIRSHNESFSVNTLFFLYSQLNCKIFLYPNLQSTNISKEMLLFYQDILDEFEKSVNISLEPIKLEQRDQTMTLVITEQFISINHGPTKTALDRCRTLVKKMNKKVLLLNTAELLSFVGYIPFYRAVAPSYDEKKLNEDTQHWKDVDIPYVQCEQSMPDLDMLEYLLTFIKEMAPGAVVLIGGVSVLGNLVNKMLPVLTIGTVPSSLPNNTTKYKTLSRDLNDDELELLQMLGQTEQNVVKSMFTSSLKPQTEYVTRKDFGIDEDKFLLVVVGARLDVEITDEFLMCIDEIIRPDMCIAFIGKYENYEKSIEKYDNLRTKSIYLGFCDDILSRIEICDLYVNPLRTGGGTSCVEAMFKGLPVVTINYGDVAINAGEDFCVQDYRQMQEKILKYHDDSEYYRVMSKKAEKRTELLLDTDGEFVRILEEMDRRENNNVKEFE